MDPTRSARRAQVFNNLFDAVLVTDRSSCIVDLNPAAESLFGIGREDAIGQHLMRFIGPEMENGMHEAPTKDEDEPEINSALKGHLEVRLTPLFDEDGEIDGALCVCRHQQSSNLKSKELAKLAHTDALTGLANRTLFVDRLRLALANSRRTGHPLAVLFMDLDGFKHVNDKLGHAAGDRVLKAVGQRLEHLLRENDTLARWGGDEFVALLTDIRTEDDATRVADKLLETMRWPVTADETPCQLGLSIGIAMAPHHGRTADALMRAADGAMYSAKKTGKQRYRMATPKSGRSESVA